MPFPLGSASIRDIILASRWLSLVTKYLQSWAEINRQAFSQGVGWLALLIYRKHHQQLLDWQSVLSSTREGSDQAIELFGGAFLRLRLP